ncbi:MAG: alpha-glucan family phosphorylase [Chitinophagales bacterium]
MIHHKNWHLPYTPNPAFRQKTAYFCMEFGVHQALKIYSGGLGYLAGSHMRSAYELKQNLIGIGILWRFGYYDQVRDDNGFMAVQFQKKLYTFLKQTDISFDLQINGKNVHIKTYYLPPDVFGCAPLFLMSADFPENDEDVRKYTHRLYDNDTEVRVAQNMILGIGGAKIVEMLGGADIYHMNEGHALAMTFYLFSKWKDLDKVRAHVVFTTHTPEKAGNEEHDIELMDRMGFFSGVPLEIIRHITKADGSMLGYTPASLYMSKIANGVSKLHGEVSREMWKDLEGICPIIHVTNAQQKKFWADREMDQMYANRDDMGLVTVKKEMKRELFEVVANQTGKIFDPDVLTIVWARRFAEYKRANLLMRNKDRFLQYINDLDMPVQIIWAGKPYPMDHGAVNTFNDIISFTNDRPNLAVLTGYEIGLSYLLKRGADVWLNTPRRPREASGTSGMSAAMNGAVNVSVDDGWIPEFAKHRENCFIIPPADHNTMDNVAIDNFDYENLMQVLENEVSPLYYKDRTAWLQLVKNSMRDVYPYFDSDRLATEYYQKMYAFAYNPVDQLIDAALKGFAEEEN